MRRYERKQIEYWRFARRGSVFAEFSRRRGRPPTIIFARIDRPMNALPLVADKRNIVADVHLRLIGKRVLDFLLVLIELFSRCYR